MKRSRACRTLTSRSSVLDNPALVECGTRLAAEALLKWETFERVRALLEGTTLTFRLEKLARGGEAGGGLEKGGPLHLSCIPAFRTEGALENAGAIAQDRPL